MRPLLVVLLVSSAGGCADDSHLEIGVIDYYGESDGVLEAPATAHVGDAVVVRVLTFGNGCVVAAYLDDDAEGRTVTLTPYDQISSEDICTDELNRLVHERELAFDAPGTWTLVVHGRRVHGAEDVPVDQTYTIDID